MINKYKHLKNGYTAIFFKDSNNKETAFFIDTNCFEIANSQDLYWNNQLVNAKGTRMPYNIAGRKKGQTSKTHLSRLLLECNTSMEICYNITGNPLDLRKCNLLKTDMGTVKAKGFQDEINELIKTVPPLPQIQLENISEKKEDVTIPIKNDNIRFLTDEKKNTYILLENGIITVEIDKKYAKLLVEHLNPLITN
ncbi:MULTISPECIES: hypothetical protein [Bacillus cereus group]|uniref:Uncharacterized protein n=1 Tax=Bacillus cereus TaxID=1396 RepID=A0A9W7QGX6_BACCE|nr:hypothetical protein [Bacillus cereus]KAB2397737.1 hypothetical protein F8172_09800 [Bacillus cereus]KAB2405905.1 hypothetical protein F8170_14240 [Bacillus cereus]KAB2432014.1 hypothetical protein F8168_01675 [Bacillus cereus]